MHKFGWLSEKGGNFLNLLQKEEVTQKRGGVLPQKRGVLILEETIMKEELRLRNFINILNLKNDNHNLLKRKSNADVFLRICQNFQKEIFC